MTELGEKWIKELTGEANSFDIGEAEFWLCAAHNEIIKRAVIKCDHQGVVSDINPCWMCIGREFEKFFKIFSDNKESI